MIQTDEDIALLFIHCSVNGIVSGTSSRLSLFMQYYCEVYTYACVCAYMHAYVCVCVSFQVFKCS